MNTCKLCGCTDMMACPGGCHWIDSEQTICSQCAMLSIQLVSKLRPLAKKHSFDAYENPNNKVSLDSKFILDIKILIDAFNDREFDEV